MVETGAGDGCRESTQHRSSFFQYIFGKEFAGRSQVATENGFLRTRRTAYEFESQRGCGVAALDVVGIA
jgi:hypothetical protein